EPTYGMHGQITRISGTRHLRARRNPNFTIHPEASIEAIQLHRPDVVFLCSPNNPTGNSNTAEEVIAICEASPALVILDEAYVEFSGRGHLRLVEECDNLVVTRSFSKSWRLAGARIGDLVAPPRIIDEVQKVRLPYHFSALSQATVLTALNHADEIMGTIETIAFERAKMYEELTTLRGVTAFPSDANFILFRCDSRPATEVWQDLLDKGILVRDFSEVPGCENCLRVSVGTHEENEKFLEALSTLLTPR
ncbi:MAG TPA: aminotransferase class I/II-fold pyridoxal phosphate-dependent enzyme, partial [Actinomycetota bacterium]|nr:aminotransferase class I/II-fold pyridoxal phosphate-dependent enzyme [Actinomycetota bacterium]